MAFEQNNTSVEEEEFEIDMDFDDGDEDEGGEAAPAWLSSYSDMMTDLMAIFVVLFSFAMMSTSQQNFVIKDDMEQLEQEKEVIADMAGQGMLTGMSADDIMDLAAQAVAKAEAAAAAASAAGLSAEASGGESSAALIGGSAGEAMQTLAEAQQALDRVYESIRKKISESGYADSIGLEKGDGYILFQFKDNVLFYPDSPVMRESGLDILQYMGDLLLSVQQSIGAIEISGHTAKVTEQDSTTNFFAWELSSDRAISVLRFFVQECDLPQAKMQVAGYAHHMPVADNDTEEGRSRNRRVEVKIVRVDLSKFTTSE